MGTRALVRSVGGACAPDGPACRDHDYLHGDAHRPGRRLGSATVGASSAAACKDSSWPLPYAGRVRPSIGQPAAARGVLRATGVTGKIARVWLRGGLCCVDPRRMRALLEPELLESQCGTVSGSESTSSATESQTETTAQTSASTQSATRHLSELPDVAASRSPAANRREDEITESSPHPQLHRPAGHVLPPIVIRLAVGEAPKTSSSFATFRADRRSQRPHVSSHRPRLRDSGRGSQGQRHRWPELGNRGTAAREFRYEGRRRHGQVVLGALGNLGEPVLQLSPPPNANLPPEYALVGRVVGFEHVEAISRVPTETAAEGGQESKRRTDRDRTGHAERPRAGPPHRGVCGAVP